MRTDERSRSARLRLALPLVVVFAASAASGFSPPTQKLVSGTATDGVLELTLLNDEPVNHVVAWLFHNGGQSDPYGPPPDWDIQHFGDPTRALTEWENNVWGFGGQQGITWRALMSGEDFPGAGSQHTIGFYYAKGGTLVSTVGLAPGEQVVFGTQFSLPSSSVKFAGAGSVASAAGPLSQFLAVLSDGTTHQGQLVTVPEPATAVLLALGLALTATAERRRRRP